LSLKEIITIYNKELKEKEQVREETLSTSRKITLLSKQAVMAIHRSQLEEAKSKLKQAKELIKQVAKNLIPHQDLATNSTRVAYQEYAEAQIFLKLTEEDRYPDPKELDIPIIPYILGLADSVGEFRRRTLDFLRKGKLKDAERCLQIMDEVYTELISLESAYSVAPELRRKCDIARHVIEATIGDVATETRRISLERSIRLFEKKIGGQFREAILNK
jgi:translin